MAKKPDFVGETTVFLQIGVKFEEAIVPVVEFVGPWAVHETVSDHRLAEAKTAAYSVSHTSTGLGLINGVQTKKGALGFAEEALGKAQELGLDLSVATSADLALQAPWQEFCDWALAARVMAKTRKGFLYD